MTLHVNWKRILRKAWSLRLSVLSGILAGAEVVIPFFADSMPRGWFAAIAVLTSLSAAVARVIAQPRMHDDTKPT